MTRRYPSRGPAWPLARHSVEGTVRHCLGITSYWRLRGINRLHHNFVLWLVAADSRHSPASQEEAVAVLPEMRLFVSMVVVT